MQARKELETSSPQLPRTDSHDHLIARRCPGFRIHIENKWQIDSARRFSFPFSSYVQLPWVEQRGSAGCGELGIVSISSGLA